MDWVLSNEARSLSQVSLANLKVNDEKKEPIRGRKLKNEKSQEVTNPRMYRSTYSMEKDSTVNEA